jgi:predicted kinase
MYMSKVAPTKPLLILLYGFPGAGKSHFAHQLSEHLQVAHVHGDRIRGELFETPQYDKEENDVITHLMDYMTSEFLNAGLSVIYDVNAMRAAQRRLLRDMARKHHAQPLLVWFQIDLDSAYARVTGRDRRKAEDKYAGPSDQGTFERQVGSMQNPQNEDYVVVSGKHAFGTQLSAFMKRLRELGFIPQVTEVSHKLVKPGLVNLIPNPAAGRVDMSRRNIVIR